MPNWKKVITSGSDATLNTLEITSGSAADLTVTGNVGIGTTSPTGRNGFSGEKVFEVYNASSYASINVTGNGSIFGTLGAQSSGVDLRSSSVLRLYTNNSTRMTIDTSGNVGIGTTSPGEKLEVAGNIKASDSTSYASITPSTQVGSLSTKSQSILGAIVTSVSSGNTFASQDIYEGTNIGSFNAAGTITIGAFNYGNVNYQTAHNSFTHSWYGSRANDPWLTLNVTGLGIGTTTPAEKLTVEGNISGSGTGSFESIAIPGTTTDYYIGGSGGGAATNNLRIGSRTVTNTIAMELFHATNPVSLGVSYSGGDALAFIDNVHSSFDSVLQFKTGGSERFRIGALDSNTFQIKPAAAANDVEITDNSGAIILYSDTSTQRIGIGTTSPTEKLHVDGTVKGNDFFGNLFSVGNEGKVVSTSTLGLQLQATAGSKPITFFTNVGGSTEKMRITEDGKVGIGTTTPAEKLTVEGNISGSGNVNIVGDVTASAFVGDGSALTGVTATDSTKLPLAGGTMTGNLKLNDNVQVQAGSSADLLLYHAGTHSFISNTTGDLNLHTDTGTFYLYNNADDGDISFQSDNGSGGLAEYFKLDGTNTRILYSQAINIIDDIALQIGNSQDLRLFHDGNNSYITQQGTGDLIIQQSIDDRDIKFQADDGSGGVANYFVLDGSNAGSNYVYTNFPDKSVIQFGDSNDLQIFHDSVDSTITNHTGNLYIQNRADDKDIILRTDNGSGNYTEYLVLDGSTTHAYFSNPGNVGIGATSPTAKLNVKGSGATSSTIALLVENSTGTDLLKIDDSGDTFIPNGNLSLGGAASTETLNISGNLFFDATSQITANGILNVGAGAANISINSPTGDITITGGVTGSFSGSFQGDGSGITGITATDSTKLPLAGGTMTGDLKLNDNVAARFGTGNDLSIYHNGATTLFDNNVGDIMFRQFADDKDIIFQSDDGSGGIATYFRVDGGEVETRFLKSTRHFDNVSAYFGDSADLQIYHDGSHSYIKDSGTGFLFIEADAALVLQNSAGESYLTATSNGSVSVRYDNAVKLETTSTGVEITGDIKLTNAIVSNQENTDVDLGAAQVIAQVDATNHNAAFFDYVIKKGTNLRAGTVTACHDGTLVEFTETSTSDLGSTAGVNLSVFLSATSSPTLQLLATVPSDDWSIKTFTRGI